MRPIPFLFCLAILTVAVSAQKPIKGSEPVQAALPNYLDAYCSELPDNFRVCRVRTTDDGDAQFLVQKNGSEFQRIEAPFWSMAGAGPTDFITFRTDLDKDGSKEIVLVSLDGVGNGMGISYSTVHIFDGRNLGERKPLSFYIEEFGDAQNFVYNARTRRTEILISYWMSYDSIDRKRGWGQYLIGKWFRYRNGKLVRLPQKPTLARRYLNSFARQRNNMNFDLREPFKWLTDRRANRIFREPDETTKPKSVQYGTISQESEIEDNVGFVISSDDGKTLDGTINADSPKESVLNITSIGEWRTRYLYPLTQSGTFSPSVFFNTLVGRKVRLETYERDFGGEFTKMWLLD